MNYGVKSTTMDDLAKAMGVSKKTLYLYVENKADLVSQTMTQHLVQEKEATQKLREEAKNAIDEMYLIGRYVTQHLQGINPTVINDLQRYYPEAWAILDEYKKGHLSKMVTTNIERGIKEGLYRDDLNPEIIAKIYSSKAECVVDHQLFPFSRYAVIDVYREFLNHHIRGIASAKGAKYLEANKM